MDNIEPRLLKEKEIPQAISVWDACFVNTPEFTRWYFQTRCIPERVMGLFDGEKLVCDALMIPYRMKLRGKSMAAPFIVGAATLPEYRRRGHMESVLKAALAHMREMGVGVTFLHPFRYGFYARLGWERATRCLTYRLGAERVKALFEPGSFARIKRGDGERMRPIYQSMTINHDLTLLRGERECELRLEETLLEGGFGLIGEDAYALCCNHVGTLRVFELAGEGAALFPLLGALAREPGVEAVEFPLPYWEAQPQTLMDENPPELSPYLMMRVVDVEKTFSGMRFNAANGRARIEVADAQCPWNSDVFEVAFGGGMANVLRSGAPADAAMDIGTLSMLISGYFGFEDALKWGMARAYGECAVLRGAFTAAKSYVLEKY